MVQLNQTTFHHGEVQAPRMTKNEKAVSAVQNLIDSWNNPFALNQNVVRISTAKEAPDDVRRDKTEEIGNVFFSHQAKENQDHWTSSHT